MVAGTSGLGNEGNMAKCCCKVAAKSNNTTSNTMSGFRGLHFISPQSAICTAHEANLGVPGVDRAHELDLCRGHKGVQGYSVLANRSSVTDTGSHVRIRTNGIAQRETLSLLCSISLSEMDECLQVPWENIAFTQLPRVPVRCLASTADPR